MNRMLFDGGSLRRELGAIAIALSCSGCSDGVAPVAIGLSGLEIRPTTVQIGQDTLLLVEISDVEQEGRVVFRTDGGVFVENGQAVHIRWIDGADSLWLDPPLKLGQFGVSASGAESQTSAAFRVTPAPIPTVTGLGAEVSPGSIELFTVQTPPAWRGRSVEVRATAGVLQTIGPADSGLVSGSRVLPVLDALGKASLRLAAPSDSIDIWVMTSLFGSTRLDTVAVRISSLQGGER